jgi:hypothetical protein
MTRRHLENTKSVTHVMATVAATVMLTGCVDASSTAADDRTQVMQSLLSVLTADGKPACVDARTRGKPLAIFRTMMVAPDPARRPLAWFVPQPLRPQGMLSSQQLFDDQFRSERVVLTKPRRPAQALPNDLQGQLNAAAGQLSLDQEEDRLAISDSQAAPLAKVRWWVRNRFDQTCSPIYTISNPVIAKNVAFVSVTAGHWGTTYAFQKKGPSWATIAQWTNWIY